MADQNHNWKIVLLDLYDRGIVSSEPEIAYEDHISIISERTDLSHEEVEEGVETLYQLDLFGGIYDMEDGIMSFWLTTDGFEKAHAISARESREKMVESQNDAQKTLADFTIILGMTALVQALASVASMPRYNIYLSVVYLIILAFLYYYREQIFHTF